jgi:hypothetical protein
VLLQALLAAKGISSSGALVNTGAIYHAFGAPSPFLFNHIITYVPELNLYLDSTARFAPFGTQPEVDAGKPVVLTATAALAHTPVPRWADSELQVVTHVKLAQDGTGEGDTKVTATGGLSGQMRSAMNKVIGGSESAYLRNAVFGAVDGTLVKPEPTNLTEPYVVSAHYKLANAAVFPGPSAVNMWLGYHPYLFSQALSATLPARHFDYVCPSYETQDETTIEFPSPIKALALPDTQKISVEGITLESKVSRVSPSGVRESMRLRLDHPSMVCTAEYYNRIHASIMKAAAILNQQIVYRQLTGKSD